MEAIPPWVFEQATPWGVILLGIVLIATGRLVPFYYYKELKEDRDRWRSSSESLQGAVSVFSESLPEILDGLKTTEKVVTSIQDKANGTPP